MNAFLRNVCQNTFRYSSVPNRRAVRNKRAGGKILKKTLNVQDRIDVQGENFSAKSIIVQGENKRAGGN